MRLHYQGFLGQNQPNKIWSNFSWTMDINCLHYESLLSILYKKTMEIHKYLVNTCMFIFHVSTSICFVSVIFFYFAILRHNMRSCIRKINTSVNILFIFCEVPVNHFATKTFVYDINFVCYFHMKIRVKYKYTCTSYFRWLVDSCLKVRQRFKKNSMEFNYFKIRHNSLIDLDHNFLWSFTRSKFASKLWPS